MKRPITPYKSRKERVFKTMKLTPGYTSPKPCSRSLLSIRDPGLLPTVESWTTCLGLLDSELMLTRHRGLSSQGYGFSSSHVWMWELDHKESWAPKNWCFWTVVLEKTLESPLDCKEIQPVPPKGNQSWLFIGRIDAEAEASILWQPDVKNWVIGKDPDAGRDWGQEEKGMTEDEMVGWHH